VIFLSHAAPDVLVRGQGCCSVSAARPRESRQMGPSLCVLE
jgi:hypothetical protein